MPAPAGSSPLAAHLSETSGSRFSATASTKGRLRGGLGLLNRPLLVDCDAQSHAPLRGCRRGRDLRLHLGVGSKQSPVATEDTIFNDVDLLTWTLGVSGSLGRFQFAAGFNHQSGNTNNLMLRNLLNGRVVQTAMDVSMTGFIYSLAYRF